MDIERDIVDRFLSQATAQPDHPAVVDRHHVVSYRAFERRIRQLAALFALKKAPKVLIALPQVVDAYATIFAAALAGGFHTPLNVGAPIEKLIRVAAQLQPDYIVGAPDISAKLKYKSPGAQAVDPGSVIDGPLFEGLGTRHQLAYVIFTSGSTGMPKGVMVPRSAINHYVGWLKTFEITPADRVSQQPNLAFDISMTDIFGALCYGATLVPLYDKGDRLMPAQMIAREKITIWNSTPSVVGLMMRARQVTPANLASVRLFNFCGEPLLPEHVEALFAANPKALCQNTYGPTEATISMTVLKLTEENYPKHSAASISIGRAIPNMGIVLVGGQNCGEGELVITGPQLANGYWNDDEKTASVFKPVRVDNQLVSGYYTGDWVERRDDDIFFRERLDFQVKVRGYRVELDEVAAAIRTCGWPVVCVFKRGGALAAVVERVQGQTFKEATLRKALFEKLEDYAIPERILTIERMPRSENDKLDRKAATLWFENAISQRRATIDC